MLLIAAGTSFAEAHRDVYSIPCSTLWPAVKDTVRNSGEYRILWFDNNEWTASFAVGGQGSSMRINAVVLNAKGENCEMQVQTGYGGGLSDDAHDLKKRVDASLGKQHPAKSETPNQ
jgi:hypothetical protein